MAKNNKKSGKKPASRKLPLLLAAGLAVLIAVLAFALWPQPQQPQPPQSDTFPQLEVAGYSVTREEYLQAMYQARNDVLSDHAAAGISLKNWQEDTALGNPCELITHRTLEILSEYYAISTLAVGRGYLADASYAAMLRDMEDSNRQRQETLASGGIITGIPHFTPADYLTYRASNLRIIFCNDSDNPDTIVSPEEIRQRYDQDKDNLYLLPDEMELSYLLVSTTTEDADALTPELEALKQLALEKGDLALALEEMPQLKGYYQELSVDRNNYSVYARSHGDILAFASELEAGEISQVYRQDGWLCLIQCHQRTHKNYAPLGDVESVVVQSIREGRYDALVARRMEEIQIQADLPALYRFTAEQFQ